MYNNLLPSKCSAVISAVTRAYRENHTERHGQSVYFTPKCWGLSIPTGGSAPPLGKMSRVPVKFSHHPLLDHCSNMAAARQTKPLPAPSKTIEALEHDRVRYKLAEALGRIYTRAPGSSSTIDNRCVNPLCASSSLVAAIWQCPCRRTPSPPFLFAFLSYAPRVLSVSRP